jgi:hypothetical protein
MPSPPPSEFDEIDARICALESEIRELKRRRNSITPIFRLPSEILVTIIQHVQNESKAYEDVFSKFDHSWVRIMLVCQHLRTVAVQTPTLWTVIDHNSRSAEWRDVCHQRSATAPLQIQTSYKKHVVQWGRAVVAHIGRLPKVDVSQITAPLLRVLRLSATNENHSFCVTSILLNTTFNSLVYLHLGGLGVSLKTDETVSLPCLRYLKLGSTRIDYNLDQLAHLLRHAQSLEHIIILRLCLAEGSQAVAADEVIPISSAVTLPRLRTLYIDDAPAEVWALLRLMSLPQVILCISVMRVSMNSQTQWTIQTNIVDHFLNFYNQMLRTLEPPTSTVRYGFEPGDESGLGTITFGVSDEARNSEEILSSTFGSFSTSFCTIRIEPDGPHPALDRVCTLHIHCKIFGQLSFVDLVRRHGVCFLEAIHTVVLEGLQANLTETNPSIQNWIKSRGGRIKCVKLIECHEGTERFAEELRLGGLVPDVAWSPKHP